MANRIKEDEKNEKAIRALLKLPENRRCINCNSLGPQYVCTTFWTFICMSCSGIHREFTHRVKSISMATFTAEEVTSLQAGGNERARKIYLKEWDFKPSSYPDPSNIYRLREFIKQVYVGRKYMGDTSEKLPTLRLTDREDSFKSKNGTPRSVGSPSPSYEDRYGRSSTEKGSPVGSDKSFKFYYDEKRSPRYAQENVRSGGVRRNPVRFEVVDDRFRDDERIERRTNFSKRDSKANSSCPDLPVRDTVGDDTLRSRAGDAIQVSDWKDASRHVSNQKTTSSQKQQPSAMKPLEKKIITLDSLIDFTCDNEPPDSKALVKVEQVPSTSNSGSQSSSLDMPPKKMTPQTTSLEDLLFGPEESSTHMPVQPSNGGPPTPQQYYPSSDFSTDDSSNGQLVPATPSFQDKQSTTPDSQGHLGSPIEHSSTIDGAESEHHQGETKSSVRTEIPADLFASFGPPQLHHWQSGPPHGSGYNMQYYPSPVPMGAYPQRTKSTNPFDIYSDEDTSEAQLSSMSPTEGTTGMNLQSPSFSSGQMGHQVHNNMLASRQHEADFGYYENNFGSNNATHQPTILRSRGNPFE